MTFEELYMKEWIMNYILQRIYYDYSGPMPEDHKKDMDLHFEEVEDMFDEYEEEREKMKEKGIR